MSKISHHRSVHTKRILSIGIASAIVYWLSEGLLRFIVFESGDFNDLLFPSNIYELFMRLVVVSIIIGSSFYAQALVNKLNETTGKYKALFDNAPDAIFLADSESGLITDANPAALKMVRRHYDEIVGLHQSKLHPPVKRDDSTRFFFAQVKESKEGKESKPTEQHVLRSDGVEIPVEIMAKTVDLGSRSMLQSIFRDVSERRIAQEKIRQSEERFRLAMEVTNDALWDWDMKTNEVYRNPRHATMLGYQPGELKGGHEVFKALIHPDDTDFIFGLIDEYIKGKEESFEVEYRMLTKSGDCIWVLGRGKIVAHDENGLPSRMIGTYIDITRRKKMEDALKESEERYRTLVEGSGAAITAVDKDGTFLFMNEFGARLLGGKPENFIGKTMWDVFPKDIADRQMNSARQVIRTKSGINVVSLTTVRDTQRWYNTILEPLHNHNNEVSSVMIIARDIDREKRAEEQLENYRSRMAQTERLASLGTLSATVAHELTQPLTVLALSLQNSLDRLYRSDHINAIQDTIRKCLIETSNMTSIVERFRSFARRSSIQSKSDISLQNVAEKTVQLLRDFADTMGVKLKLEGLDKLPHIHSYEKDLEQLFFALIDNAIQQGDKEKEQEVAVSGVVTNNHIELQFFDSCGGIPPENLDMIFEPFFTTKPQGTGLGLSVAQDAIARMDGKIRVESTFGKGSTFIVTLPIRRDLSK